MKNLYTICSIFLSCNLNVLAQPTITSAQLNPVIGESISVVQTNWISPGSGGPNLTWNFSSLISSQTGTLTISGASASFPGTNQTQEMVMSDGSIMRNYSEVIATGQFLHGFDFSISGSSLTYNYSNTEKMLQFPLSISTTFTDAYSGTFSLAGIPGTRTGNVSFSVDGYGTITTPSGTYSNVLRVRFENTNTDVSAIGTNTASQITYLWYKAGIHYPILYLTENIGNPSLNEGAYYVSSTLNVSSIDENEVRLYPNPVEHELLIESQFEINEISIVDPTGKTILDVKMTNKANKLDVSQLESGVYFVHVKLHDGTMFSKTFIKK